MKTQMQDTSKEAFKELRNLKIEGRRLEVYDCIKRLGSCSNSMISRDLSLSINKITGRVNELRNYFKVVGFSKKDICPVTKRQVMFWKVVKDFDNIGEGESKINFKKIKKISKKIQKNQPQKSSIITPMCYLPEHFFYGVPRFRFQCSSMP